jgi:hypothetical protein
VFFRQSQVLSIIEKVRKHSADYYDSRISLQKPFGLKTYVVPTDGGGIQLRYNKGIGPFQRNNVTTGTEWIEKWKVIM